MWGLVVFLVLVVLFVLWLGYTAHHHPVLVKQQFVLHFEDSVPGGFSRITGKLLEKGVRNATLISALAEGKDNSRIFSLEQTEVIARALTELGIKYTVQEVLYFHGYTSLAQFHQLSTLTSSHNIDIEDSYYDNDGNLVMLTNNNQALLALVN